MTCGPPNPVGQPLFPLSRRRGQHGLTAPVCGQQRGCAETIPSFTHRRAVDASWVPNRPSALAGSAHVAIKNIALQVTVPLARGRCPALRGGWALAGRPRRRGSTGRRRNSQGQGLCAPSRGRGTPVRALRARRHTHRTRSWWPWGLPARCPAPAECTAPCQTLPARAGWRAVVLSKVPLSSRIPVFLLFIDSSIYK